MFDAILRRRGTVGPGVFRGSQNLEASFKVQTQGRSQPGRRGSEARPEPPSNAEESELPET